MLRLATSGLAAALMMSYYSSFYCELTHEVLLATFFVPPQHTLAEFAYFLFEG